jgi:hypothetical protein
MSRAHVILYGPKSRAEAHGLVEKAPPGTRVDFKGARRSIPQNSMLWALLTARAKTPWMDGQRYSAEDWKDYFMHALNRGRWMPKEEGGYVPVGMRSSDLSKQEMGDLLELVMAHCAAHQIDFERQPLTPGVPHGR